MAFPLTCLLLFALLFLVCATLPCPLISSWHVLSLDDISDMTFCRPIWDTRYLFTLSVLNNDSSNRDSKSQELSSGWKPESGVGRNTTLPQHVHSVYWHCDTKRSTITVRTCSWFFDIFLLLLMSWATICFPAGESKVEADYLTSMVWSPRFWWNLIHRLIRFRRSAGGSCMTSWLPPAIISVRTSVLRLSHAQPQSLGEFQCVYF